MSAVIPYPHNPNMATPYPSPLPPNPLTFPLADYRGGLDQFAVQLPQPGQIGPSRQSPFLTPQGPASPFQYTGQPSASLKSTSPFNRKQPEPQFGFTGGLVEIPAAIACCCCCCPILLMFMPLIAGAAALGGK